MKKFSLCLSFICLVSIPIFYSACAKMEKKSPERLSSAEIIESVIRKQASSVKEEAQCDFKKRRRALYSSYESNMKIYKQKLPSYEVAGDLKYTMTQAEMATAVKQKFRKLYRRGSLITREDFKRLDKDKWFYKPGSNLTRIWGAHYLEKLFIKDKKTKFKVPEYIIVVDDLDQLKVTVAWGVCHPIISSVQGDIYARRIDGVPAEPIIGYGFDDYTGPNILKSCDGAYFVIDTEYRSFYKAGPEKYIYSSLSKDWPVVCEYLKNRFLVTQNIDTARTVFEFSVI